MKIKMKKIAEIILASSLLISSTFAFAATPAKPEGKVQGNQIRITAEYNADVIKAIEPLASKIKADKVELDLSDINDADFATIVDKYQGATSLYIKSPQITSLEPLKKLPNITRLIVESDAVTDFSPIASCKKLNSINITSNSITSIAWLNDLPKLTSLYIESKSLKDLTGIPKSTDLHMITIARATLDDLTPITNATNLKVLNLKYGKIKDLTPIGTLTKVEDIDLYGAVVEDFSPLASIPKIKKLMAYATSGSDYSTLGKLKNLEYLNLGMTKIKDISFVPEMTGLKRIEFFNEEIADYSPITKSNVEYLKIWQMKSPVDLSQIKGTPKLTTLELTSCDKKGPLSNLETISTFKDLKDLKFSNMGKCALDLNANVLKNLPNLKSLYIEGPDKLDTTGLKDSVSLEKIWIKSANKDQPIDLAFLANTSNLKEIHLEKVTVKNFDAIAGSTSLETLDVPKAEGITSLAAAKALPNLKNITIKKDSVPESDLSGFANAKARVTKR